MKKATIIIITIISLISCDDFLTIVPDSQYTAEVAYKTPADFRLAILAVYSQQQLLYSGTDCWFRTVLFRSDDMQGNQDKYLYGVKNFTDRDNQPMLFTSWGIFFKIIARCNEILARIDPVYFKEETTRAAIKGEAHALRAWAYWNLGWQYGGVPIIDKPMTLEETRKIARSTVDETFAFAETDFLKAINLLPANWVGVDLGRISKYAAEGGLARLYMFRGKLSQAKPLLEDIINSGVYDMAVKYSDCFSEAFDNTKERVWEIQFTGNQLGGGNAFITGFLPEGYKYDLTAQKVSPVGGNSAAQYVNNQLVASYESGDLRKDVSLIQGCYVNGIKDLVSVYVWKFHNNENGYVPKATNDWATNIPVIRYTDILLMYAEILNEEAYSSNGKAFELINKVRKRAGLSNLTSVIIPDQAAFRTAIRKERRVEFAFEGIRWLDLLRWGIAEEEINKSLNDPKQGGGKYQMKTFQRVFAIPGEEIRRYNDNTILWQNEDY